INEFMADNDGVIEDPDEPGEFPDWIELYNAGNVTVQLGGMYMTDDLSDPTQWQIPAGVSIPAMGVVVFWADGEPAQGDMHADFKLSKDGESIGLFDTDAHGNEVIDSITFGAQTTDVSYGRDPDGSDNWVFFTNSTPGALNGLRGDLDCDGSADVFDIDAFVLAITNPAGYAAAHPGCNIMNADCNGDDAVDVFDIDAFVAIITGG
ncbi:MAG: lamin tail domain-containing protein, partial [Phycisphaerae bacterium]|nr:lamin tail domain-containing protein [Phycisphaerae bacterium]